MFFWKSILCSFLILVLIIPNAFAEENYLIDSTSNGTLDVKLYTIPDHPEPGGNTKLKIEFLNPKTNKIQEHIDYRMTIEQKVKEIFRTNLTHTSTGSVSIPFKFDERGSYDVYVYVEGVLFSPIPMERAIFSIQIGQELTDNNFVPPENVSIPIWVKNNAGWWSQGQIADSDFVSGIQYLISNGIMTVPQTQSKQSINEDIPDWIKNNAGWWSQDKIGDSDFVSGIQYLISNGIMTFKS